MIAPVKIRIRLDKKELQYLTACCQVLYERKKLLIAINDLKYRENELNDGCQNELPLDFENLKVLTALLMVKCTSPLKRPLLIFNASFYYSLKRIINRSGIALDEYYQILLADFFSQCNEAIALLKMQQSINVEITQIKYTP